MLINISSAFLDSQDTTKDIQKKSKRKGRNKQEVQTVSQTEPEQDVVKTPIDLVRVSPRRPERLYIAVVKFCVHDLGDM